LFAVNFSTLKLAAKIQSKKTARDLMRELMMREKGSPKFVAADPHQQMHNPRFSRHCPLAFLIPSTFELR
jgi:hypothetical protein